MDKKKKIEAESKREFDLEYKNPDKIKECHNCLAPFPMHETWCAIFYEDIKKDAEAKV